MCLANRYGGVGKALNSHVIEFKRSLVQASPTIGRAGDIFSSMEVSLPIVNKVVCPMRFIVMDRSCHFVLLLVGFCQEKRDQ